MARRRRRQNTEEEAELNLAPIMNMVMILIPLMLVMVIFQKAGVINISTPRTSNAPATEEQMEEEEETPIPKVVISISADGFRLIDQSNIPEFAEYSAPIGRCGGAAAAAGVGAATIPPTICLLENADPNAPLVQRLDFAGLYNQLVRIRLNPAWFEAFATQEGGTVVSLLGDPEIPYAVVVKTMDASRYFLAPPSGGDPGVPTAASNVTSYLLGGGETATMADYEDAQYVKSGPAMTDVVNLFPDPVLLLPRPQQGG